MTFWSLGGRSLRSFDTVQLTAGIGRKKRQRQRPLQVVNRF